MQKMTQNITAIITTSPVRSNPDTSMINEVIKSMNLIENLFECKKLLICDGYKINLEN